MTTTKIKQIAILHGINENNEESIRLAMLVAYKAIELVRRHSGTQQQYDIEHDFRSGAINASECIENLIRNQFIG